jgi:phosphatidylinositol alpha-1,6-mannosyltransferase
VPGPVSAPAELLIVTTELFATGGLQRLGRDTIEALAGGNAGSVEAWSFLDAVPPAAGAVTTGSATVRLAAGSRWRMASWALERARHRCDGLLVLAMHVHVAPVVIPLMLRGARAAVFLLGVEAWRTLTASQRFVVDRADRLIAISRHTANRFKDANPRYRDRAIDVCPPGIGEAPLAASPPAPGGGDVALMVSRMSSEDAYKGHERLLRAWPGVRARAPRATLVLVGDGDDRPRLQALAADLGLADAVQFTGLVADEALADWYGRCRFFVLPSEGEGFGLVFLEAMRSGKACIAGPGAPGEIVEDGVTGLIVPPRDEEALAGAVSRLFLDQEFCDRLGRHGRARFEQVFTARRFAERLRPLVTMPATGERRP